MGLIKWPDMKLRRAHVRRVTNETRIALNLNLDGKGQASVKTGIPFFDHMLTLFAKHAVVNLRLRCQGDLAVDAHHTVEDCGLALGQAFAHALGDKKGIRRYGAGFEPRNPSSTATNKFRYVVQSAGRARHSVRAAARRQLSERRARSDAPYHVSKFVCHSTSAESYVPMDECLARCVIDFSGRPCLIWRGLDDFAYKSLSKAQKSQDLSTAFRFGLAREFFQGFANQARCTLHLELLYGDEPHHIVEALFKAFAKAVDVACQQDARIAGRLPTTKGKL